MESAARFKYYDMPAVRVDRRRGRAEQQSVFIADRWESSRAIAVSDADEVQTRPEERSDEFHHQEASSAPHLAARHGRVARLAAARFDGAGADAAGQDRGGLQEPAELHLRAARRDHGQVDSGRRRARASSSPRFSGRSRSSAIRSAWSRTWRTPMPAAWARTPAPITRVRPRSS